MRKYKQVHIKSGKIAQMGRNFGWHSCIWASFFVGFFCQYFISLAGTLVFGPAFFAGFFLASISYLWLALFFILVLQPQ